MKKFYNDPSMNISLFEEENVVTTSGTDEKIATKAGTSFIKGKLGDEATVLNFVY